MRLVLSVRPIGSFMEPEASNTNTMSSGVVAVSRRLDVEEIALKAVRKSESLFLEMVLSPPAPVSTMSPAETVLSVQMRPTFWVLFSRPQLRHVDAEEGSANVVAPTVAARAVVGANARSTTNNKSLRRFMATSSSESQLTKLIVGELKQN